MPMIRRDVAVEVFAGPGQYLLGEETALMEAINGRPPFPRVAPPFRRGVDDVMETSSDEPGRSPARVELAEPDGGDASPPSLVDNVETLANVTGILNHGAGWFRSVGTDASPGTILCTVTGAVASAGVVDVALGTTLAEVIELAPRPREQHGCWPASYTICRPKSRRSTTTSSVASPTGRPTRSIRG